MTNPYRKASGGRVIIYLTNGGSTTVDDDDYDRVKDFTWSQNGKGYATAWDSSKGQAVHLHRLLMNPPADKPVDHADRDRLNNCRSNLRVVTVSENNQNRGYD